MDNQMESVVTVSVARDRKWKILGLVLVVISLALYIFLAIMFSKHLHLSNRVSQPITTKLTSTIQYETSTNLPDVITTMEVVISSEQSSKQNSEQPVLSTMFVEQTEKYINYSLPESVQYYTSGRSLGNSLYFNFDQMCLGKGYISSVSIRLFNNWEGDALLYLFIISLEMGEYTISSRYAVNPKKNTTEWQTFEIPLRALPVYLRDVLAVGMQESSTNQIYAARNILAAHAGNISENATIVSPTTGNNLGVALGFIVVPNVETATMETRDIP